VFIVQRRHRLLLFSYHFLFAANRTILTFFLSGLGTMWMTQLTLRSLNRLSSSHQRRIKRLLALVTLEIQGTLFILAPLNWFDQSVRRLLVDSLLVLAIQRCVTLVALAPRRWLNLRSGSAFVNHSIYGLHLSCCLLKTLLGWCLRLDRRLILNEELCLCFYRNRRYRLIYSRSLGPLTRNWLSLLFRYFLTMIFVVGAKRSSHSFVIYFLLRIFQDSFYIGVRITCLLVNLRQLLPKLRLFWVKSPLCLIPHLRLGRIVGSIIYVFSCWRHLICLLISLVAIMWLDLVQEWFLRWKNLLLTEALSVIFANRANHDRLSVAVGAWLPKGAQSITCILGHLKAYLEPWTFPSQNQSLLLSQIF